MIDLYGTDPDSIESAMDLATDYERRLSFQANIQEYVDMSISSTINLPAWGSKGNNEDLVVPFANTLAKYAHRLRGFTCFPDGSRGGQPLTCFPDGSRGGQPLTVVPYKEAVDKLGEEFEENIQTHDICEIAGTGGVCGV
jgi:ribonucleoside-diphosphate reductase alpha chain